MTPPDLKHLDETGQARMVDVSNKSVSRRVAVASGRIRMTPDALEAIVSASLPKGDVLVVARLAGIQAAKQTPALVPLCHPLPLEHVAMTVEPDGDLPGIRVVSEVVATARTGAEMEALVAVTAALLTVYDMAKAVDRTMTIEAIRLDKKSGGASGSYARGIEAE